MMLFLKRRYQESTSIFAAAIYRKCKPISKGAASFIAILQCYLKCKITNKNETPKLLLSLFI